MEKVTRRTVKRWTDYTQDHSDLGAALNGFSLNESGPLAASLEKTGQAVDATYVSTLRLVPRAPLGTRPFPLSSLS
jgi:hypothetical protein